MFGYVFYYRCAASAPHDLLVQFRHEDLDGLVRLARHLPGEVVHGVQMPAVAVEAPHAVGYETVSASGRAFDCLTCAGPKISLQSFNFLLEIFVWGFLEVGTLEILARVKDLLDSVEACKLADKAGEPFDAVQGGRVATGLQDKPAQTGGLSSVASSAQAVKTDRPTSAC